MKFIVTSLISAALLQLCGAYEAADNYQAYLDLLQQNSQIDPLTIPQGNLILPQIQQLQLQHLRGQQPMDNDGLLTMAQICHKYGFAYEEHKVTTEDGYILTVGRIPGLLREGRVARGSKPAIILQHGLGANMMQWVVNTPETTHAFLLARAGYDVWMGNNRGTKFSLGHVKLNSKKNSEYWDFTWEEMGTKDQPAQIDYILKLTGQQKLSYMGHSEGTTQLMAGGSLRPEFFNSRIAVAILLAPPASMVHSSNSLFKFMSTPAMQTMIKGAIKTFRLQNFAPGNSKLCKVFDGKLCSGIFDSMAGSQTAQIDNLDRAKQFATQMGSDAGAYNFVHYGQLMHTKSGRPEFNRFDHGMFKNMRKYGQFSPPHYNLKNLQFPIALLVGTYDDLANVKDVAWLYQQIKPYVIHYQELPFGHLSFQIAKDMSYLPKTVLPILNRYSTMRPQANQYYQLMNLQYLNKLINGQYQMADNQLPFPESVILI